MASIVVILKGRKISVNDPVMALEALAVESSFLFFLDRTRPDVRSHK
jgi:hypothetical protein